MPTTYAGVSANATGTAPAVTVPVDTEGLTAASITGPVKSNTDWLRRLADIALNIASTAWTWTAAHVFNAGVHVTSGLTTDTLTVTAAPTMTYPALVNGAFVTNFQKLGWWADAEGNLHIEGTVGALPNATSLYTLWAAGTVPSQYRPLGPSGSWMAAVVTSNGTQPGALRVYWDGSLVALNLAATNLLSVEGSAIFNPRIAVAP